MEPGDLEPESRPSAGLNELGAVPFGDAFLSALVGMTADAVVLLDDDLNVIWSTPSVTESSGWRADELRSLGPADIVHPDDLQMAIAGLSALRDGTIRATPSAPTATVRLRRGDGTWRWTDVVGRGLRLCPEPDGPEIDAIALAFRDAEDRVRANIALEASERRHRALVQHSNDGVVVCDANRVITDMSESVTRLVGWSFDAAVADPGELQTVQFLSPTAPGTP